jgi:uncharacterized protein (DUF1499 family)
MKDIQLPPLLKGLSWLLPLLMVQCAGASPSDPDAGPGRLKPCPDSPNCVSTQSQDKGHRMEPLEYETDPDKARERLRRVIESMPRARVATLGREYIHVEFRSRVFRFVDDVEFCFDDEQGVIHFRSASRKGYSDLGANRKRMEQIRTLYLAQE